LEAYFFNSISCKISFKPNKKWVFDYTFHFSETSPFNCYYRLFEKRNCGLCWAEWYYGPQKWQKHRVAATFNAENKFFNRAKWVVANQFFEESLFDRRFNNNNLNIQKETVNAVSVNLDFEKKTDRQVNF
jgi:hemoglobin/transferrin/lactoferrin receptor protein